MEDEVFPLVMMTYGYEVSGYMYGLQAVANTEYRYSKNHQSDDQDEPYHLQPFEYYTEVKVDGKENRAISVIYEDETRKALVSIQVIDFRNARVS